MSSSVPKLGNKMYDVLKFTAQIALPAAGTLYATIAGIWGLPASEQVVGTVMAVDAFLGILLGISTKQYNDSDEKYDGVVNVRPEDGGLVPVVGFNTHPLDAMDAGKKEITLKLEPDPAKFDSPPKP